MKLFYSKLSFSAFTLLPLVLLLVLLITGCLITPVSQSGSIGSVTVTNSNPNAIITVAQSIFANYGYTPAMSHYPTSVSFNKNSNKFATVMWGSYANPQTIHVKVQIIPIPGSCNYRLSPQVSTVSNAGVAGFESKRPLISLWNHEFGPLLRQIASQASGAGAF